jgi:hypothetical protein
MDSHFSVVLRSQPVLTCYRYCYTASRTRIRTLRLAHLYMYHTLGPRPPRSSLLAQTGRPIAPSCSFALCSFVNSPNRIFRHFISISVSALFPSTAPHCIHGHMLALPLLVQHAAIIVKLKHWISRSQHHWVVIEDSLYRYHVCSFMHCYCL